MCVYFFTFYRYCLVVIHLYHAHTYTNDGPNEKCIYCCRALITKGRICLASCDPLPITTYLTSPPTNQSLVKMRKQRWTIEFGITFKHRMLWHVPSHFTSPFSLSNLNIHHITLNLASRSRGCENIIVETILIRRKEGLKVIPKC